MGAKSQFTKDQDTWLEPVVAEFKAKLASGTVKDDTLLSWKKGKCEDFLREFQAQLEATDDGIAVWRDVCLIIFSVVAHNIDKLH